MVISSKKLPKITRQLPGYYPELPKITRILPENNHPMNLKTYPLTF